MYATAARSPTRLRRSPDGSYVLFSVESAAAYFCLGTVHPHVSLSIATPPRCSSCSEERGHLFLRIFLSIRRGKSRIPVPYIYYMLFSRRWSRWLSAFVECPIFAAAVHMSVVFLCIFFFQSLTKLRSERRYSGVAENIHEDIHRLTPQNESRVHRKMLY